MSSITDPLHGFAASSSITCRIWRKKYNSATKLLFLHPPFFFFL
jgi:hypothetical protein